jgi:hypothetical protein
MRTLLMKTYRLLLSLAALAAWVALLPAADPAGVEIELAEGHVDFRAGKDLVARYHTSPGAAKPYFWPVHGPGGVPVTRAWPMEKARPGESTDHPHQKSAWFCHGDVIPEGIEVRDKVKGVKGVDFWSETRGHGRIVCTKVGAPERPDRNHARITTHNEWRTAGGVKVLDETRTLHLYDFGDTRLLVLDMDLQAGAAPVTFGDTKEGSLGVRVHDSLREQKGEGKIENAEGKTGEKACWGRVSAWCDYSGPVGGRTVGLAVLDDPANPHPACWHCRGYGLMAANPFGRAGSGFPAMKGKTELVRLAKGEHLRLRYGLLLHPGDAREGKVAEYFRRFVELRGK